MTDKLHNVRYKLLAEWLMGAGGRSSVARMTADALAVYLETDESECIDMADLVADANRYAARRKCADRLEIMHTGGVRIVASTGEAELKIFEYWQRTTGRMRTKPNAERIGMIRARLAEGFTARELAEAIKGLTLSSFHVERGYLALRYAIKDEDTVRVNIERLRAPAASATCSIDPWAQAMANRGNNGN